MRALATGGVAQSGLTAAAGRNLRGIRSSELKGKFQAALRDSQVSDSKVSTTSVMYPVSNWRKFD